MNPIKTKSQQPFYHGMHFSREEYLDLKDDGYKYDMIDGVLYMSPSASAEHGITQAKFLFKIMDFLKNYPIGEAILEVDIFLPDGGDVLRPDISFILKENLNIIKTHIHGVPDLIVEILSSSTKERDLKNKAQRYLTNGVKEYWIVDPDEKSVQLWINKKTNWKKIESDKLESLILQGLVIERGEIFSI